MIKDEIRYDILVKDALRQVIKKVLFEVSKAGLPGDHHFFITFATGAPGVKISPQLKERYPEHMTIVLQHQFWDLHVYETNFEVSLSFGEVREKLVIPFEAIQVFCDPAASFEAAFTPALPEDYESEIAPLQEDSATGLPKETDKEIGASPAATIVSLDAFRKNKDVSP